MFKSDSKPVSPMLKATSKDVRPLHLFHVYRAVTTNRLAFATDPVQNYIRFSIPVKPWQLIGFEILNHLATTMTIIQFITSRIGLQIDNGSAILGCTQANDNPPPKRKLDTFLEFVRKIFQKARVVFMPKEQITRFIEVDTKIKEMVGHVLGSDAHKYIGLDLLATRPEVQGRGYGSALVRTVNAMADAQHRKVWLISSNIENLGFYQSCGYTPVADILLGDSNPNWHLDAVVVKIMIRDPEEPRLLEGF